ncbi:bifunctional (p)ppGpp synthetase/guanosine-3',5'-bis(diphosphate) 3'-pyrophosphohydrolase [Ignavibacteriales bacterium]
MSDDGRLNELLKLCKEKIPNADLTLIKKAYEFAAIAHQNDRRASDEPYFSHPVAVARILIEEIPFDDVSIACGLLHDVVEDNEEYSSDLIKRNFGDDVAIIVDGLTKIKELFRAAEINQAENYRKLLMSIMKDIRVIIVKFADRLHNMRTLEYLQPDKRKRIATETLEIYAPLAHRFGLGKIKWELEDLAFKELNRNAYDDIRKKLNLKRDEREEYLDRFSNPIREALQEKNFTCDLSGRPKHLYSIYRKMIKQNKPFEEIFDLFAIRLILESDNPYDCYTVFGIINALYIPVPDRFKDYIAIPKVNNYQSIHTALIGPEGRVVEVQIRTRKMHEIAERGVAAHWRYKEGNTVKDRNTDDYVQWIREMVESSGSDDLKKNIIENFKLNLYENEIFVMTPKGDLKRLPVRSTPVDFAFAIHSNIGHHCIGAKVNKKIVPLDFVLNRGDQVEIITSKNQHPNKNWLKFVRTQKAKSEIRKWLNKEEEAFIESGKEIWDKRLKKIKLTLGENEIAKILQRNKFHHTRQMYKSLGQGNVSIETLLEEPKEKDHKIQGSPNIEFQDFARYARGTGGELVVDGEDIKMMLSYSKCCNPIPGDEVAGFITTGEGIRIHRKTCRNLIEKSKIEPEKVVSIKWPEVENSSFLAGLVIRGDDSAGILKDIANTIVSYNNTSIKSISLDTSDSFFEGQVTLFVQDLNHLSRIIDKLKKIKGVYSVTRMAEAK